MGAQRFQTVRPPNDPELRYYVTEISEWLSLIVGSDAGLAWDGRQIIADEASIDHNSLANLTVGDPHTQYAGIAQNETISGEWEFSGKATLLGGVEHFLVLTDGFIRLPHAAEDTIGGDFYYDSGTETLKYYGESDNLLTLLTTATAAASYQPLDADLTAIAALTTTAFGRGLIELSDASALRTAAGLGTIATQNANNVTITGGSITGITDLAVADGGTGASTAGGARTNLGSTTVGDALFTAANVDAAHTTLGLGTAAVEDADTTPTADALPKADGSGVIDDGWLSSTVKAGRLLSVTLLTSSSANHTTGASTNKIYVRVQAGGGGGGGASSAGASAACGAGGGPGGYSEHLFTVSPSTEYAYTCGAGGTAGANTGGNGGNGGNSTFTVGGTTVTANGGTGGTGQTAGTTQAFTQGGNEGSSSNGTINIRGTGGMYGQRVSGTAGISGHGGGSHLGGGGLGRGNAGQGDTPAGYGGGGGGGLVLNGSSAVTGGTGGAGAIVVYEYS